ncbi:helix-turn-helix transcriptional regulator [Brucella thiophenivorans]|uniref:Addiction module antidote protein, HigA family n=1 Tax=Brucella thiophenivorans TaxID=571255 RepID=A0A256FTY6_9HYPH|nr:helix-turn-helix transcriptional regulator [Brucella thiophenivorans]OYR18284.1 addiction module antidote protein, HigA family [Brucella thiophenivorans]
MKYENIGQALEFCMKRDRISIAKLAEILEVSTQYVRDILNGKRIPSVDFYSKFSGLFGESNNYWFELVIKSMVNAGSKNAEIVNKTLEIAPYETSFTNLELDGKDNFQDVFDEIFLKTELNYVRLYETSTILPSSLSQIVQENTRMNVKNAFKLARLFSKTPRLRNPYFWLRIQKMQDFKTYKLEK